MPFFTLRLEIGIVIGTGVGALGLDDAKAAAETFWANPDWKGKPIVWDFRSAELEVDGEQVRELARFILDFQATPPPRVAVVTGRDVDFGMARMFEVLRGRPDTQVQVFRDYETAVAWARGTNH